MSEVNEMLTIGLLTPTIHMNGTSKEELIRQLCDAHHAINKAQEALAQAAPNGRDYYPQGPMRCQRLRNNTAPALLDWQPLPLN